MDYNEFCNRYEHFARDLCELGREVMSELTVTEEDSLYNAGTMQRDADNPIKPNIILANANLFKGALNAYEERHPVAAEIAISEVDEEIKKAQANGRQINKEEALDNVQRAKIQNREAKFVFSYLQMNGINMSYEKDGNDELFKNGEQVVTRTAFYSMICESIMGNTNYFSRHIGDLQIIALEDKGDAMPRRTEECKSYVAHIPAEERQEIFLKRGLYHESVHAALGTDDERKCDVFALLKVMREHPKYAKEVFEVYNYQRSQIGFTINNMHSCENIAREVKKGTMTYVMPRTYAALRQYAEHPERIPDTDRDILRLTYEMTANPEFSHEELKSFVDVVRQSPMDKRALAATSVMRACQEQGAFMTKYIATEKMITAQRQGRCS